MTPEHFTNSTWKPDDGPYIVFAAIAASAMALKYEPQRLVIIRESDVAVGVPLSVNSIEVPVGAGVSLAVGMGIANPALKILLLNHFPGPGMTEAAYRQAASQNHNITVLSIGSDFANDGIGQQLANGATFVARTFVGDDRQLTDVLTAAFRHNGFAFISLFNPPSAGAGSTFAEWRQRQFRLQDPAQPASSHWKADDRQQARELAIRHAKRLDTGIFIKTLKPSYQSRLLKKYGSPLVDQPIKRLNIRTYLQKRT